jgi:hypothetical protein
LTGSLPSELVALSGLQVLNVFNNTITGTIPTSLSALSRLKLLDFELNQMIGPAFVPNMTGWDQLISYRTSFNRFNGPIPSIVLAHSSSSSSLQELWSAGNELTGTIPSELGSFSNLGKCHIMQVWC